MYDLPHYKEPDQELLLQFMRDHPFAMLIATAGNCAYTTQLPLLMEKRPDAFYLKGHMMRKQDHQLAFEHNTEALIIFTGPHSYVSANWYSNPQQASTWNYMSVHARGSLQFLPESALESILQEVSLHFEFNNKSAAPVYENLPAAYRERLLKSIIGFEIKIESLEHVFKLSQNRDEESYDHIISHLGKAAGDGEELAAYMRKRRSQLFKGGDS